MDTFHVEPFKRLRDRQFTWRPLRILIYYRIVITVILSTLTWFLESQPSSLSGWGTEAATWIAISYLFFAIIQIPPFLKEIPNFGAQVTIQATCDILFLSALMYATNSTGGGLGILMVVAVTGASILSSLRTSVSYAALATILILLIQSYLSFLDVKIDYQELTQSGLLGGILFIAAIAGHELAKQAQEQAQIAERRGQDIENLERINAFIVKHLPSGIIVVSPDDRIVLMNSSARRLLNIPPTDYAPTLPSISPHLSEQLNSWRSNTNHEMEEIITHKNENKILVAFDALTSSATGTTIITLNDADALSDKVQQAKLASLGRLTASIAHEIRNPLGAISHAGQLLTESSNLDNVDKRMTQIIQDNSRRVNQIIESVLQLSRREKAQGRDIELASWLEKFIEEFSDSHDTSNTDIHYESTSNQFTASIDPNHLHQILWNVCENSFKYGIPQDGARQTLKLYLSKEPTNNAIFIEVRDNGPGIPEEVADEIFEPFYTSHTSGTGLGLYICKELAELNKCKLNSIKNTSGACFRLTFPQ